MDPRITRAALYIAVLVLVITAVGMMVFGLPTGPSVPTVNAPGAGG